jgi:GDP-4-dehydro-6-deoxy-D-mannose reductase
MARRVLVTGADGFVGAHAVREFAAHGHAVVGLVFRPPVAPPDWTWVAGDIRDREGMDRLLAEHRPDAVLHLAGQAFVPRAWENPQESVEINLTGTLNLLEAFRRHTPGGAFLAVTSSEVYGRHAEPPVLDEDAPLRPGSLYGVTKAAADQACLAYAFHHRLRVMTARPQNHIGPGQNPNFVVPGFATQLARLARSGRETGEIRVGNLDARRDFTDVRDVVRAYRLLLESGHPGQAYNIASGRNLPIRDLFFTLAAIADVRPTPVVDPALFRPTDSPPVLAVEKIRRHTGWQPEWPLEQTLRDLYAEALTREG